MDNLARLKLRTEEVDETVLQDCLESAKSAIMARRYPFQEWPEELESRWICSSGVRLTSTTELEQKASSGTQKTLSVELGSPLGFPNRFCRK